ncbi:ubiquinol-cytochrome c reductase iron-sulfur subunit [Glaciibacter sp. 2TAF33]|uniref:QcrA and Rieske domain-containing protein n=1 Tax=Glaciibacter sp. 2TAF33 TaxID=3233015 RepID=UPI003F8E34FF
MTQPPDVSRRTLIVMGGAGTALALAGCSAAASRGVGSDGGGAGGGSGGPGSGGAAGSRVQVAKLTDVPVGGSISATLSGAPILLSQPTAGEVLAFTAICTHQGCVVEPAKAEFDCPCHQSRFDATTGEVLSGPAPRALKKIPVTVTGDAIMAG